MLKENKSKICTGIAAKYYWEMGLATLLMYPLTDWGFRCSLEQLDIITFFSDLPEGIDGVNVLKTEIFVIKCWLVWLVNVLIG